MRLVIGTSRRAARQRAPEAMPVPERRPPLTAAPGAPARIRAAGGPSLQAARPERHVLTRTLRLLGWTLLVLATGELLLEARAWRHGYSTIAFGEGRQTGRALELPGFGPAPGFPFRSRIVPAARSGGTLRIWVSSSSMAEAKVLPPDRNFPSLIAERLGRGGHSVEVINASHVGSTLPDNTRELQTLGRAWRPDVAVLYQMSNDVIGLAHLLAPRGGQIVAAEAKTAASRANLIMLWAQRTTVFTHLRAQVTARITINRLLHTRLDPSAEAEFRARVLAWLAAAEAVGARPVLCTFATSHDVVHAPALPEEVRVWLMRWQAELSPEGWLASLQRLNELIRRIARERGVQVIDLEPELAGRPEYFSDFVHFTPAGHARMAELIAAALEPAAATPAVDASAARKGAGR